MASHLAAAQMSDSALAMRSATTGAICHLNAVAQMQHVILLDLLMNREVACILMQRQLLNGG